ncbi:MAG TPA: response regulator transcription factor [Flavobacteriales bacterium]|jgi:two-component system copper resistance phosphate regulon response regulator CusR|nr:response regulator transcription factor [Flavobacteriales bacterium]MBK6551940.1 response regulator transcription factor [Flavobacteriales bacterium]MBK7103061.1 response regulator transcription factor [Flavobacteriales bacterium]MBK7113838.1 response regulator transcription factor [Flavobacteriales bacterium]MBK7620784.1 response regulator transcription factor [Flavobacteriales bacterium]
MQILVVEDEPKVAAFLKQGLEESGHEVLCASDGIDGRRLAKEKAVDLVLLDVMLPGLNGVDTCRAIRHDGGRMPILMLTALGTTDDKVAGLDAGADDYLVKPFEFQELLARIRSLSRRGQAPQGTEGVLIYADLHLDLMKKEATRHGQRILLTAKEFTLLEFFMRNPDRVLPRTLISERVWDIDFHTGTNVVEAYIKLLRKKVDRDFEPKLIHNRVGLGYILTEHP